MSPDGCRRNPPVNITYQLETTLLDEGACVLLDAERPFGFKFAPSDG
jgi:hypothetical protein